MTIRSSDGTKTELKNYDLSFGEVGMQIKFNKDVTPLEIKNLLYYIENELHNISSKHKTNSSLFKIACKDTINDIQN